MIKIKNEGITIKIGNKEKTFKNLILNSYIDLFAESFVSFKDKSLSYCFIKFETTQSINEESTTMDYDVILASYTQDMQEIFNENSVVNKYIFEGDTIEGSFKNFAGKKITGIGFGDFDYNTTKIKLYAFLDVSKYQLLFQENQQVVISRIDKITTDLKFFSPSSDIKFPLHLTTKGLLEFIGYEYNTIYSELYSIGTGTLYNQINTEVLVSNLDFKKTGVGVVTIKSAENYAIYPSKTLYPSTTIYPGRTTIRLEKLKITDKGEGLYPSPSLYPSSSNYPKIATDKWVIYKFKLYRKRYEGEKEIIEDTGLYYYQSQKTDLTNFIKLEIKYERN